MADIHKAGAIIIQDKKLLLTRTKGKDIFVCPGGKLESGETPKQAVVRELKEELNISVSESSLEEFGTYFASAAYDPDKTLQLDVFIVKSWTGELVPDNEIEEVIWADSSTQNVKQGSIFDHEVMPKLKAKNLIN